MATFVNQIATSPMAIPGDSGSALLTENSHVAGLVFAGSPQISLANPIGRVFELLNLTLPAPVTPIEDILPQLGEATIWGWDNEAKTWSSFDTTVPEEFRHFMKLRFLIPGNGYWIWVNRDTILKHNGFKYELFRGWSLIGWR
ncbi:MAG: hypothetical protein DDT29_02581 [Dehalococcoidia bacterium]|nr:hypothetical protein [Bacillota bacterium]